MEESSETYSEILAPTTTISTTTTMGSTDYKAEWRGGREGGGGGGEGGLAVKEGMEEGGGMEEKPKVTMETAEGLNLRRSVSLLGAISFTVGSMIGSGIFISPTAVLRNTKSVGLNLVVWTLGGVISLFGSFTVAELACRVPRHGGSYTYLKEAFGSWLAFVYAWTHILIISPSSLAVKCLTFSRYLVTMLPPCGLPPLAVSVTAVTLIVTLYVVNVTSNVLSVRTNVVFLFTKVIALVIIIVGGLVVLIKGDNMDSELGTGFAGTSDSPASIASSFYFVMWAYGGWDNANSIVEEVKNPSRNVPVASIAGVLMVTVIYVLTNVSYLAVMSTDQMLSSDTVAVTWGNAVLGTGLAAFIVPLCVMTSTAGSANSGMFVVPRVTFAAARDGNFPEVFSYLHVDTRIPLLSVSLVIALGMVYASASDVMKLISVTGSANWFFYFLISVSLLLIRYRQPTEEVHVPFKQPLPGVIFFMLVSLSLVVVPLTEGVDFPLYFTLSFYLVGLLVFLVARLLRDRTNCCDGLVTFLQLLMRMGPPAHLVTTTTTSTTSPTP
ncbi:Y+L amino acid transporter 2-like [Babylonia areolata]|uniref:Y+L amino acid transporter 2-like n=1 Tax=Babylonia areolata TaxID=304850 RepID=UPI003FD05BA3